MDEQTKTAATALSAAMRAAQQTPTVEAVLTLAAALDAYQASPTPSWAMALSGESALGRALLRHHKALPGPAEPVLRALLNR